MPEPKITDRAMRSPPGDRDLWIVEDGVRGSGRLVARITPAGERRFYFRYTGPGRAQVRLPIGPYDARGDGVAAFTVQQARDMARDWAALYRSGITDLRGHFEQRRADARQAEEDARRAAEAARREQAEREQAEALKRERRITTSALFERWAATELQPRVVTDGTRAGRKDGGKYLREQFGRHVFPTLGERAIADVTKADILEVLDRLKAAGKMRTANVILAALKQMLAFAAERDVVPHSVIATVKKSKVGGKDTERDRVLDDDEVRALAGKLAGANMSKRSVAAVWLLLATGARVGELMGAVWSDLGVDVNVLAALPEAADVKVGTVDLVAGTWHLPDTKNQRDHTIHLSPFALGHFRALAELRMLRTNEHGVDHPVPWVFPNEAGTGPVHVKSFGKQLADRQRTASRRLQGRTKATDGLTMPGGRWTAHDLRRTAGTLMAKLGISGDVIDECLNHIIESRVRRTYIRDRRPVEQARAFDALGARLAEMISGEAQSPNVVALHAA